MNQELNNLYEAVSETFGKLTSALISSGQTVSAMESCTAGLIASLLTDTEGASAVFPGSFVTYSNAGKIMQEVPESVIEDCGVYSAETAGAMAEACRRSYHTGAGIGVTGTFADPDPANADSRPGEVWVSAVLREQKKTELLRLPAGISRQESKLLAAGKAAELLLDLITGA